SPGAPKADAGPDYTAAVGSPRTLNGSVIYAGTQPAILWRRYSGPGNVTFADASQPQTTATFSSPGVYTLILSADDGIHAVAYDAAVISVGQSSSVSLQVSRAGGQITVSCLGGTPPFVLEKTSDLSHPQWITVQAMNSNTTTLGMDNSAT